MPDATPKTTQTIREAVAAFDDAAALEQAVYALERQGFDRAAFSLLADEATVEQKLGHRYRQVAEMEAQEAGHLARFGKGLKRAAPDL